jgi:hypothetical protein
MRAIIFTFHLYVLFSWYLASETKNIFWKYISLENKRLYRFGRILISLRPSIKHLKLTNNSVEERCVFFTNQSNSLPYIDYSVGTYHYKLLHKILVWARFLQLLEIVAFKRLPINIFSVKMLEIYIYNQ